MKVLLVIEDREVRESLGRALRSEDYAVTFASSSVEALDHLGNGAFDLTVLDLDMPAFNGWDTFKRIRTGSPDMPVVLIAGRPEGLMLNGRPGAPPILEKPFDVHSLLGLMKLALVAKTKV